MASQPSQPLGPTQLLWPAQPLWPLRPWPSPSHPLMALPQLCGLACVTPQGVTRCHTVSHGVTRCHTVSHGVASEGDCVAVDWQVPQLISAPPSSQVTSTVPGLRELSRLATPIRGWADLCSHLPKNACAGPQRGS